MKQGKDNIMDECVGYVRISGEDQSTYSISGQISEIEKYCERNGLNLKKVFVEDGRSAFTFNRKEWKDLEGYLKANKSVRYLVVIAMDRFSRAKLSDALSKMDEIQRRLNVKMLTVQDPIDIDVEDMGVELKRVVELLFSNFELKKIRKRTTDGLNQARSEGRFVNLAPFGYINGRDAEGKAILIIDEEKAHAVRLAFRLFLKGTGMEEIRRHIEVATGHKLKGNSVMRRMLTNPVYAGFVPIKNAKLDKKGLHAPIISEFDYWAAQQKIDGRTITQQKKEEVYLRGVLHCNECGRLMTSGKSKGRSAYYWYYYCKTHMKNYRADTLHKKFDELLNEMSMHPDLVKLIAERLEKAIHNRTKNKGGDLMRTKLQLQKVQEKIGRVEEQQLLTPVSPATYKKVMSGLKADEKRLYEQLADLNTGTAKYEEIRDGLLPYLTNLKTVFHSWDLLRQQAFINTGFSRSLSWTGEKWRTAKLHRAFADNALILIEKGLIKIDQPSEILGLTPRCSGDGS